MENNRVENTNEFGTAQKVMGGILLGILLVFLLFGSTIFSVIGTAVDHTRSQVRRALGDEFRLDQAEHELVQTESVMLEQRTRVSKLRVYCEELKIEIDSRTQKLSRLRSNFEEVDDAWARSDEGKYPVTIKGSILNGFSLERLLEQSAAVVDMATTQLFSREMLLSAREDALVKAEFNLGKFERRFDRVQLAIDTSRFDLESVRLLQETAASDANGSSLASVEGIIAEVSKDLKVQRELENIQLNAQFITNYALEDAGSVIDKIREQSSNQWVQ